MLTPVPMLCPHNICFLATPLTQLPKAMGMCKFLKAFIYFYQLTFCVKYENFPFQTMDIYYFNYFTPTALMHTVFERQRKWRRHFTSKASFASKLLKTWAGSILKFICKAHPPLTTPLVHPWEIFSRMVEYSLLSQFLVFSFITCNFPKLN